MAQEERIMRVVENLRFGDQEVLCNDQQRCWVTYYRCECVEQ